ncbi:MAG: co-chaperone GroES [Firmicutes bacterium]|nr:co-chaperone GroES [Bacillota bacterium]MBQ3112142.1 co-chaperone GroES [Bacillota bacterium]MBR6824559.1 co-chaperone GroES [Bacillota bacterium]MBR7113275.1 co-chaperone GroES [Bacillota bacterium]
MDLKPLGERVIVKLVEAEEKTASGLILPDTAKEKPQEGTIIACGPGRMLENGTRAAMEVKVGDRVIISKYAGAEIKRHGETVVILSSERDIVAIIEE